MNIYDRIEQEREYQRERWGGSSHDDEHHADAWTSYLTRYVGRASFATEGEVDEFEYQRQLIKVAALAVAAVEASERRVAQRDNSST